MSGDGKIDLGTIFSGGGKVTIEKEETAEDAALRRMKDAVLFFVFLAMLVVIVLFCGWAVLFSREPAEFKKTASDILVAFVSGGIGYLIGKRA